MDKIDRLLDAIEHPDRYSDTEVEAMLADPEVREVYELLDKTKASLTSISKPDVDAEWESFKNSGSDMQQGQTFHTFKFFTRNVAASIAITIASLAAVAAVVGVSGNYALNKKTETQTSEAVPNVKNAASSDTVILVEDVPPVAHETIVFDNEPLENIIHCIGEYYGYSPEFSTDAPKSLRLYFRWNQAQPLDELVESLNNFEQIHISVKDKTIRVD